MPRRDCALTSGSSPRLRPSSGIASSCRGGWRVEAAKPGREAEEAKARAGNRLRFENFILAFRWPRGPQPQPVGGSLVRLPRICGCGEHSELPRQPLDALDHSALAVEYLFFLGGGGFRLLLQSPRRGSTYDCAQMRCCLLLAVLMTTNQTPNTCLMLGWWMSKSMPEKAERR